MAGTSAHELVVRIDERLGPVDTFGEEDEPDCERPRLQLVIIEHQDVRKQGHLALSTLDSKAEGIGEQR
jgi:hypothetical protein